MKLTEKQQHRVYRKSTQKNIPEECSSVKESIKLLLHQQQYFYASPRIHPVAKALRDMSG